MDFRDPEWVSSTLGLDRNTVYRFLQDGTLPAVQLGRKWLISESNLNRWLLEETDRQTRARQAAAHERSAPRLPTLSPAAREVVRAAFAEARRCRHRHLGQEHLLLGLLADPDSPPACVLAAHGLHLHPLRQRLAPAHPPDDHSPPRRLGRRPRARKAMRLAAVEARAAGARHVEPGHLLLGVLASRDGVGYDILIEAGLTLDRARKLLKQENP